LDAAHDTAGRSSPAALDSLRGEVRRETGVALTVDDVREGDALDHAARVLAGVADSALLDIGGQFLWVGPRATRRLVGIADPASSLNQLATVEMRSGSVSTASHAVAGTDSSIAVTVLAPSGATADAWSTALMGLGCDSALVLAPRLAARQVSLVCADSGGRRVRWTPDLKGRVAVHQRP
jgi:thiamine biosynthesis lipoprotein ApbE